MRLRLRPGSPPWLLRHEIRLAWRSISGNFGRVAIIPVLAWIGLHFVAYRVMGAFSVDALLDSPAIVLPGLGVWVALTLMLSTAVILSVNALYDRGDLDLLISSPLPARTIFAARGAGVAVSAVALFAVFLLPFVHMGMVQGQFGLIVVYPVLAAMALGATGIAFALTLQLVRWLGARRARVIAQIMGALIGASIFFGFQATNFLSEGGPDTQPPSLQELLSSPWLEPSSPLWWPARALLGDALPALVAVVAGTALFVVVIGATSKAFLAGTQQSVTSRARVVRSTETATFQRGLVRNILRKELRLIARDPNLIANTLLQGLYLLPVFFLMMRQGEIALMVGPAAILLLSSLAGNLAWITISGEEAPDLVGSAPVNRNGVRWLKAAAALLPLSPIALAFVVFYLVRAPLLTPAFIVFLALALTASAVIQVWGGKPSGHRDIKQRQKQNVLLNFMEVFGAIALAVACYFAMIASWWSLVAASVSLVGPLVAWITRRRDTV